MEIITFRLGHRLPRDERITTHVCLVARTFGAGSIIYSGQKDHSLEKSVKTIVENWGGNFAIEHEDKPIKRLEKLKEAGFSLVHLSAYGKPIQDKIGEIRHLGRDIVIIVGGAKVPTEVYQLADYNIGVTSQPHSEVAALAIFLHEYAEGKELEKEFGDAKIRIIPQAKTKKVVHVK